MTVDLNHRIDGSGPHVLLLHAVGMDLTLLEALATIMAKDFTVLRVDLRGHGKSPYVPANTLEDYADDVHALLTKLKFAPCGVAGFAMGGLVTQALAVKYPQDTRALVIANVNHAQTKESFAALMGRVADAQRLGMAAIMDVTMERWFNAPFRAKGGDAPVRARLLAKRHSRVVGRLHGDGACRYRAQACRHQGAGALPRRRGRQVNAAGSREGDGGRHSRCALCGAARRTAHAVRRDAG